MTKILGQLRQTWLANQAIQVFKRATNKLTDRIIKRVLVNDHFVFQTYACFTQAPECALLEKALKRILPNSHFSQAEGELRSAIFELIRYSAQHDILHELVRSIHRFASGEFRAPSLRSIGEPRARNKILMVTGMFPNPLHAGGLRLYDLILELAEHNDIDLFSGYCEELDKTAVSAITSKVNHFYLASGEDLSGARLAAWLQELGTKDGDYDIIQLEYPNTISLIQCARRFGKRVLFTYMECMARRALLELEEDSRFSSKLDPRLLFDLLAIAADERYAALQCDMTVALTTADAAFIQALSGNMPAIVPTGVSSTIFPSRTTGKTLRVIPASVMFLGFYDHLPNQEALRWYLNSVHPKVKASVANYSFRVVGRGNLEKIQQEFPSDASLIYVGQVDEIGTEIDTTDICVAPLISGAGLRGKINQYSAFGKATVSTSIGVSGMPYVNGRTIFIADEPDAFADAVIQLLTNAELKKKVGQDARDMVLREFSWKSIIRQHLEPVYQLALLAPRAER